MESLNIEVLLNKLSVKIYNYDELVISFYEFFINNAFRYVDITRYLYNKSYNDPQNVDFMLMNIDSIIRFICSDKDRITLLMKKSNAKSTDLSNFSLDKILVRLRRLSDHLELENERINFSKNREDILLSGLLVRVNNALQSSTNSFDSKVKNIESNLNTNILTVLGIFSAIIVVFFGGFNALSNVFSNINSANKYRLVFFSCLSGVIVFDIIFLLLYTISKFLDRNIGRDIYYGIYKENSKLQNNFEDFCRIRMIMAIRRFPFVIGFNIFLSFIMFATFICWKMKI